MKKSIKIISSLLLAAALFSAPAAAFTIDDTELSKNFKIDVNNVDYTPSVIKIDIKKIDSGDGKVVKIDEALQISGDTNGSQPDRIILGTKEKNVTPLTIVTDMTNAGGQANTDAGYRQANAISVEQSNGTAAYQTANDAVDYMNAYGVTVYRDTNGNIVNDQSSANAYTVNTGLSIDDGTGFTPRRFLTSPFGKAKEMAYFNRLGEEKFLKNMRKNPGFESQMSYGGALLSNTDADKAGQASAVIIETKYGTLSIDKNSGAYNYVLRTNNIGLEDKATLNIIDSPANYGNKSSVRLDGNVFDHDAYIYTMMRNSLA